MAHPVASVVVPTYNRMDKLLRLLGALDTQVGIGPFEVVVADDCSTDATLTRLADEVDRHRYALRVVASERNTGPAGARNRGWQAAVAPVVAFVDDDVVPDPGWLAALHGALDRHDVAWGPLRAPDGCDGPSGPFSQWGEGGDNGHFDTANIAYRRSALEALGGFDEEAFRYRRTGGPARCINGEDTDLGVRARDAGFGGTYCPGATAVHDVLESDWRRHLRDMRRMEGLVLLFSRHPELRAAFGRGWFYRSVDKAVLVAWAAALVGGVRPRPLRTSGALAAAFGVYLWQFRKTRPDPRSALEWASAVPLGFVADTYAVAVMARASLRYRTLLL